MKYLFGFFVFFFPVFAFAQTGSQAQICDSLSTETSAAYIQAHKAEFQSCQTYFEKQNQDYNAKISDLKTQAESIQRDINLLTLQIKQSQNKIQQKQVLLKQLSQDINVKSRELSNLENKLSKNQETLSVLLRKANAEEHLSLVELLANDRPISDFFAQVDEEASVKKSINSVMEETKDIASSTEADRRVLQNKHDAEEEAKSAIEYQRQLVQTNQKEKARLLAANKSGQKSIEQIITANKSKINQIKAALFPLLDTSQKIDFGTALQYANAASEKTSVRPALILAILTQESNLGSNVGSCYVKDYNNGAGVRISSGAFQDRVMNPTRDIPIFIQLTQDLGADPQNQRVSCPLSYGWGGAMGPAQFIPSTWRVIAARVMQALSESAVSPWNPEHAIMASALFLSDRGAGTQNYSDEKNAACQYYSGKLCYKSSAGSSYGASVMKIAANIQECKINPILGISSGC